MKFGSDEDNINNDKKSEKEEKDGFEYGFLRIYRGELGYWRLDTPISA